MKHKKLWLFFLVLIMVDLSLYGQLGMGSGRISGIVTDQEGNPLPGAQVTVENLRYKTVLKNISDKNGKWGVSGIASGRYFIIVKLEGYREEKCELTISFSVKRAHKLDVTLKKEEKVPVIPSGKSGKKGKELAALLEAGINLYNQEKYDEAIAKFEEFAGKNPSTYQVYINIGNSYREKEEFDKAIQAYQKFLEKLEEFKGTIEGDEDAARVLATIGEIHLKQDKLDEATDYFRQAIETSPTDAILAYNVGEISFKKGKTDLAIEYLKIATEIKEDWPDPYLKLGYAYLNKGDFKLAVESFKTFLKLAPDDPQAPTINNLIPQIENLIKKEANP